LEREEGERNAGRRHNRRPQVAPSGHAVCGALKIEDVAQPIVGTTVTWAHPDLEKA